MHRRVSILVVVAYVALETLAGGPLRTTIRGRGFVAGDPVDANSGYYWMNLPLLDLGGPIPLRYVVVYSSEPPFLSPLGTRGFDHNVPRAARLTQTELIIQSYADANTQLYFTFSTGTATWAVSPEAGIQYQLIETGTDLFTGWLYLMDPVTERVYVFEKFKSGTLSRTRLRWVLDRNGNQLAYTYVTATNRWPSRIEDGLGRSLALYYQQDRVVAVTDHVGRSIGIAYYSAGVGPREITDALGQTNCFCFSNTWAYCLTHWVKPLSNVPWANTYAETNYAGQWPWPLVRSQTDAYGNTLYYDYDTNVFVTYITDPDSNVVIASHLHEAGPPQTITDAASNTYTLSVTERTQISQIEDRAGRRTAFAYHESGFLESMTNALGRAVHYEYITQSQTFTNPADGETVSFTFTKESRVIYPDGSTESFAYDERGNLVAYTNLAGHATYYQYNERGWPTNIVNGAGGRITLTWLTNGVVSGRTDSDGVTETFQYDALFRLTNVVLGDGTSASFTYDNADRVTSFRNGLGQTYALRYDANGNLVRITDPAGNSTRYGYDLMDRLVAVTNRLGQADRYAFDRCGRLASITDPNGVERRYEYDARGWVTAFSYGAHTWRITNDVEGAVRSVTSPMGFTESYGRDALGNLTSVTNPLGQVVRFQRDPMNRVSAFVDALGRTNEYHYTADGLLAGATVAGLGTVAYHYNALGLLDRITDFNGREWHFTYTPMGRLATQTDPLTNTWTFSYDVCGRVAGIIAPDGSTLSNRYDAAGNLTNIVGSGGTAVSFTYDAPGQLAGTDGVILERDAEGRVTNTVQSGISFAATYDDGGRITSLSYNNGALVVTYTYDPTNGLLRQVSDNVSGAGVSFTYDADMRPAGWIRSNGVNAAFTWDNASRLVRLQDGTFLDITYDRDAIGQVTQSVAQVPLDPATVLKTATDSFGADAACQVNATGYAYDRLGRLVAAPGVAFAWDGLNRLTNAGSATLIYNGLNDVMIRVENGQTNEFFYNYAIADSPIVAERSEGTFARYYVCTPDGQLLYFIDSASGNRPYYFHFDFPGSTLALTDTNGAVTDAYAYDPHGRLLGHVGSHAQPFTFLGRRGVRQEGTNGLYQMGVRYYDARTARFLSREPLWPLLSRPQMLNPYVYALNNPVSVVDPSGWMPFGDPGLFVHTLLRADEEFVAASVEAGQAKLDWREAVLGLGAAQRMLRSEAIDNATKEQLEKMVPLLKKELAAAAIRWWRKATRREEARKKLMVLAGPKGEAVRKALGWVRAQLNAKQQRLLQEQRARENRLAELNKTIRGLQDLANKHLTRRQLDLAQRELQEAMALQTELDRLKADELVNRSADVMEEAHLFLYAGRLAQIQSRVESWADEEE